jgi:flagellar motor component MotA
MLKKHGSQIAVAIVCCILGFILTYQFKTLIKQENEIKINTTNRDSADVTAEIEQYKKTKEEMDKK